MSETGFQFCDELGPSKVVYVYEPRQKLRAIVVVDNIAAGPAIGGVRMAPDVSVKECFRLARAMTLKSAAAGLPHGGGKSVIFADPHTPDPEKEGLIRSFACAIREIVDYIPGPDMGTDETCMAWIRDEIGRAAGLPPEIGGIPLDDIGATGHGLAVAGKVACERRGISLSGVRIAVQGFGSVGQHVSQFLTQEGAVLVAAADSRGAILEPTGLDVDRLIALKSEGRSVVDYGDGEQAEAAEIIAAECDIWIPAARPDVIRVDNVERLRARIVLEGANIPTTPEAEKLLHQSGVLVVPDFIANAGGVICAAVEYRGGTEADAFRTIEAKIGANTTAVLDESENEKQMPREAAESLAQRRIRRAMALRRWL
ncbi:MAG: Glu/Leu/Phe/Val dehydrogenase [Hyphomicrobiales bacterium]|nr:Glu/Leu/Phe/Val dehydrogenase [Hyphomicrobiales bacterium]